VGDAAGRADREVILQSLLAIRRELAEIREMLRAAGPARAPRSEFGGARDAGLGPEAEIVELEETPEPRERRTAADYEKEAIRRALADAGGNRRRAAEILEIGERTLYRKIKQFGLD
jgi:DNA-binding NtrC family response regulator